MPFGESFNSTIKSNKSIMLDKSRRFRKSMGGYDILESKYLNSIKAHPKQMQIIKEKIQKENRQVRNKQLIILSIIMLIIISIIVFYI